MRTTRLQARAFRLMIAVAAGVALFAVPPPASAIPTGDAAHASGRWTSRHLIITAHRLGAVRVGMSLKQAQRAAGVHLTASGDGEYGSSKAPGLVYEARRPSCLAAFEPSRVHSPAGATFGWTLARLRRTYGRRLHFHTGQIGIDDPTSYYVRGGRDILFFHLTHFRSGKVDEMAAGRTLGAAYC